MKSQHGRSLYELSQTGPVLVVFLRHSGCSFTREALSELTQLRATLAAEHVGLAIVHMGGADQLCSGRGDLSDVDWFEDADQRLYRSFQVPRGGFWQILAPTIWWRGFQSAVLKRNGFGRIRGDVFQLSGAALIEQGQIVATFFQSMAHQRPDYLEMARCRSRDTHGTGLADPPR